MNDEAGLPIVAPAADVPTDLRISIRSANVRYSATSVRVTAVQIGQIWRLAHADYVDRFGRA